MTRIKMLVGVLAVAGMAAGYSAFPINAAEEDASVKVLKQGQGATFAVGTKKAVALYQTDAGACQVSVVVSETYPEQMPYHLASVKFSARVAPETSTQVATSDGGILQLSCAKGASALNVRSLDSVAYVTN
jgi:hypothetical protein